MPTYLVFTWAPDFEILGGFQTREDAQEAIRNGDLCTLDDRGDYIGIIKAEDMWEKSEIVPDISEGEEQAA